MQAIILNKHKEIELYNGETTTQRIVRLLTAHNIEYTIVEKLPEQIDSPSIIIDNNIVFNEQVLLKSLKQKDTFNLYELNRKNTFRIGSTYQETYISTINNKNKKSINTELRLYDLANQSVITTDNYSKELKKHIAENENVFIVSSKSLTNKIVKKISTITNKYVLFNDYKPNPSYDDIKKGLKLFKKSKASTIIAIGGGSTIDTAKCIKAFTTIDSEQDVIDKNYQYSDIKLIAIPSTSGTGSESTEVAIMYYKGEKLSVDHPSNLPNIAILDYNLLKTLPDYQKKCVMLDALCQSIEAFWSKNRTALSLKYSKESIKLIINNYKGYLNNEEKALQNIQIAANLSGKAITIAKTTAPHTMCYRLTTKYNIAHGHAVALTLINNWHLINAKSIEEPTVQAMLLELSKVIGYKIILHSILFIEDIIKEMELPTPDIKPEDIDYLLEGIDMKRLSNHPISLTKKELQNIYESIK